MIAGPVALKATWFWYAATLATLVVETTIIKCATLPSHGKVHHRAIASPDLKENDPPIFLIICLESMHA